MNRTPHHSLKQAPIKSTPQEQSSGITIHATPTMNRYVVNGNNETVRLGDEWKSTTDTRGRRYFYNRRTRETAWQPPQGLMKVWNSKQQHTKNKLLFYIVTIVCFPFVFNNSS